MKALKPVKALMDFFPFSYQIVPAWLYHAVHHPYEQECQYKGYLIKENWQAILDVCQKLSDDFSKQTFLDVILFRLTLDAGYLKECSLKPSEQYFIPELCGLGKDEIVADCGAYTGDTLCAYMAKNSAPKKYYLYEAESKKEEQIMQKVRELKIEDRCVFRGVGVYSKNARLNFAGGMSGGSHIAENSKSKNSISVVSLDKDIKENLTFIKMDIEGAEQEALKGCKKKLAFRPKLAISIYHKVEDLWKIPQFLFGFYKEKTKFLVRHYNDIGRAETVFFTIPN